MLIFDAAAAAATLVLLISIIAPLFLSQQQQHSFACFVFVKAIDYRPLIECCVGLLLSLLVADKVERRRQLKS